MIVFPVAALKKPVSNSAVHAPAPGRRVKSMLSLMALEPRLLFDGALAVTADAVLEPGSADFGAGADAAHAAVATTLASQDSNPAQVGASAEGDAETSFTVRPPANLPPEVNPDERVIDPVDGAIQGNVIAGSPEGDVADIDPEGDDFFVVGVVAGNTSDVPQGPTGRALDGQYGTIVMTNDGSYAYVPNAAFVEADGRGEAVRDEFSYLVCDDAGNLATTTLTIRNEVSAAGGGAPANPGGGIDPVAPVVPGPGDPAPGDPGPPVVVAPTDPLPSAPTDPGGNSGSPGVVGNDPVGPMGAAPGPYTLLGEERLKSLALPADPSLNAFSPFAPMAVLGMVETPAGRAAALAAKAGAPIAGHEDCMPDPKPKAVKRANVLADGDIVKPKAKAFSEQIQTERKRIVPVKTKVVAGRQC